MKVSYAKGANVYFYDRIVINYHSGIKREYPPFNEVIRIQLYVVGPVDMWIKIAFPAPSPYICGLRAVGLPPVQVLRGSGG